MHLQGFTIDLDAPAGIAHELVQILEAYAERAIESSERVAELLTEAEDAEEEHNIQKEGLTETIMELEAQVKKMSLVSAEDQAKHRKALSGIMEDLAGMSIE